MSQRHTHNPPAPGAFAPLMGAPVSTQPFPCDRHADAVSGDGQSLDKDDDARVTQHLPGAGGQPLGIQHQGRHSACKVVGGHPLIRYGGAALGQGESQPMTQADPRAGGTSVRPIAGLQPDRRVVIELTGPR